MAYADLNSTLNPAPGVTVTSTWGDQIRDNDEFLVSPPTCIVSATSAQNVSSASLTVLTANFESYDNAGMHSTSSNTSQIAAPVAGVYRFEATLNFAANATGHRYAEFLVNGTDVYAFHFQSVANASNAEIFSGSRVLVLAAGSYVEVRARQTSGGSLGVTLVNFSGGFVAR